MIDLALEFHTYRNIDNEQRCNRNKATIDSNPNEQYLPQGSIFHSDFYPLSVLSQLDNKY